MTDQILIERAEGKERVALDLALKIASIEDTPTPQTARAYWLTLYRACWRVAYGTDPDKS